MSTCGPTGGAALCSESVEDQVWGALENRGMQADAVHPNRVTELGIL